MIRRPPRFTRTDTLFPYTTLFRSGQIPKWDVSRVRPAGARLKTFGGRASGPEPLVELFEFSIRLFENAKGRRLSSIECHDLLCKVADIVVVGGVRRSAMIALFDCTDDRSEEHTSELQSLMRISYAVFCLKKKKTNKI